MSDNFQDGITEETIWSKEREDKRISKNEFYKVL